MSFASTNAGITAPQRWVWRNPVIREDFLQVRDGGRVRACHRTVGDAAEAALLFKCGQTCDECPGVWMQWVAEDLPDGRDFHEPPRVHHPEAVHELRQQP